MAPPPPSTTDVLESAVGISFGSEYCALAAPLPNGRAEIFANEDGDRMIPSCVAFTNHGVVTAGAAKQQQSSNLVNTLTRFKDLIGLPFDHPETKFHQETTSTPIVSLPQSEQKPHQQPAQKTQSNGRTTPPSNGRTTPPSGTPTKPSGAANVKPPSPSPTSGAVQPTLLHTPPAYEIALPDPSDPTSSIITHHTPSQVASLLLSRLRESASGYIGRDVTTCCIATPNHWTQGRSAELEAAALGAGFENVILMSEHSAVLSCLEGLRSTPSSEPPASQTKSNGVAVTAPAQLPSTTVLSVSVGAHSTSAQLFLRTPQAIAGTHATSTSPSTYLPLSHVNNSHLGAALLTDVLSSHIALEFTRKYRIRDVPTSSLDQASQGRLTTPLNPRVFPFGPRALSKLRRAASRAKRALSNPGAASASVAVESLYEGMDVNGSVSTGRYEGMCDGFVREVGNVVKRCVEQAGQGYNIDEVVVWGGGGRIPALLSHIRSLFPPSTTFLPSAPVLNNDPDDLVALGCAIHLNQLRALGISPQQYMEAAGYPGVRESGDEAQVDETEVEEWRAAKVLQKAIAVATEEGGAGSNQPPSRNQLTTVIPAGTPVPVTVSRIVSNVWDGQRDIEVALYEVPPSHEESPQLVATLVVPDLPADIPAAGAEIELRVHVDEEMGVSVVAHERHKAGKDGATKETGKVVRVKVPGE
ncbi:Heat shock 70 kDa protein 14 [Gonapodya sp. JEL0774]|nr:Heat shock 70 kDa protein 14 [Gonapodya sp. JEL0774]